MIRLRNATKHYVSAAAPIRVLRGLDLHVAQGEFMAIMGASGSGKSTLMNIIGCLDGLDGGTYELAGSRIDQCSGDELAQIRNRQFGFVFQLFNLIPRLTALRNVELPMVYAGVPAKARRERAMDALERVGLQERWDHSPARLSGGQQQRVAIARAIVNDPQVLIADEPTGSLDSQASAEIMNIFAELHGQGKTLIMVTHEHDIAAHAQRTLRLRDGEIEKDQRN